MKNIVQIAGTVALMLWWALAGPTVHAQAPRWSLAIAGGIQSPSGQCYPEAAVADGSGNLFVTGAFIGQVAFGSTTLTSTGADDIFVAKYVPATGVWAWAVRGGGTDYDYSHGIAVWGNSVYITGSIKNNRSNTYGVTFGSAPQYGATATASDDLLVAKYTDAGTSATLNWTQVGGGTGNDGSYGIAVSGSGVYITGYLTNDSSNSYQVVLGGSGSLAGTVPQYGTSTTGVEDLLVVKYFDQGTTATVAWSQVGGGASGDRGQGIAVNGSSVYVTGSIANDLLNSNKVVFGAAGARPGTVPQYGASSTAKVDIIVAKYTDQGTSATLGWTQVGGGTGLDIGYAIAVSGSNVYVTGYITNTSLDTQAVVFGGTGATPGTRSQYGTNSTGCGGCADLLVAKYTDNGSSATVGWTQVGGGSSFDYGTAIATSGNQVYVTGTINNNLANANAVVFGGTGTLPGAAAQQGATTVVGADVVVAAYTDQGTTAALSWTQVGGGTDFDKGVGICVSGSTLYVAGQISPIATFGNYTVNAPYYYPVCLVGGLANAVLLATSAPTTLPGLCLFPNPAHGTAAVRLPAGSAAALTLLDALGRPVRTCAALAGQDYSLSLAGLAPGVYALRVQAEEGQTVQKLVIE
ncbi:MAG: beta strand repeat-containing protein [Janthinobacterium lividum]